MSTLAAPPASTWNDIGPLLDRFRQSPTAEGTERLRERRLDLARFWLGCSATEAAAAYTAETRAAHDALFASGIQALPRTPDEEHALTEAARPYARGWASSQTPGAALALMLLCPAHDVPKHLDLEGCPDWLLERYVNFLLAMPALFQRIGEADTYYRHLCAIVDLVHTQVCQGPATERARKVAQWFADRHCFMQAYFNDQNVRPLFEKRAAILETFARMAGCELNHVFARPTEPRAKLRAGLLTGGMPLGSEAFYQLAVLEHLDRASIDLTIFSQRLTGSNLEKAARQRAQQFITLPKDIFDQVRQIRAADLDVLIIGTNVTAMSNTAALVAAHRLARVQIALMASPVTTGFTHIDELLSSPWNEPPGGAVHHYKETLRYIDGSLNVYAFQHDNERRTVNVSRQDLGIPQDATVFFSGANYFKILPELSKAWTRILAATPNSYLVLMPFNPNWCDNYWSKPFLDRLEHQLGAHGISSHRLRVVNPVATRADLHAVLRLADVYLDGFPFSGACSLVDPLTVGCPIVARHGATARTLHSHSTLRGLGLEEWSAPTDDDYEAKAIRLGTDPALRQQARQAMAAAQQKATPYLDTRAYGDKITSALHQAYSSYVERSSARLQTPPEDVDRKIAALSTSLASHPKFQNLNDANLIDWLIRPFFGACQDNAPPPHLIDVGACYGSIALPFLEAGWTADLFEPDPAARAVLEKNLAAYGSAARLFPFAAGSTATGALTFYRATTHGLSGLGAPAYGQVAERIEVPCVRLGDFLPQQRTHRAAFLKIDAEGFDFDVLQGHDFTTIPPRLVMVEFSCQADKQSPQSVRETLAAMRSHGYEAYLFLSDDDSGFRHGNWHHRITAIQSGRNPALKRRHFGNILFYQSADPAFPAILLDLLEGWAATPPLG